jgi:hypothetical protein
LRRFSGAIRHAGWGMGDQALSSMSNFGVSLAAARASTTQEFGAFGIAFATYLIGIGIARALVSDVYLVKCSGHGEHEEGGERYPHARETWGAALWLALLGAAACGVAAALCSGDLRAALAVVAVGLPVLVLQDVSRFVMIGQRDATGACATDGTWLAVFAVGLVVAYTSMGHFPGATACLAIWVIGAACALVVSFLRLRVVPALDAGRRFFATMWEASARYFGDWLATGASIQVSFYVVGAVMGLAVVGDLRAGVLLLGPLNILTTGAVMLIVPELARFRRRTGSPLYGPAAGLSGLLVVFTVFWLSLVALAPERVLEGVLGETAADARSILPAVALFAVLNSAAQGPLVALRSTGSIRRGTKANAPAGPVYLIAPALLAWAVGSAGGALLGWTIAAVVAGTLALVQLHRANGEREDVTSDSVGVG